MIATKFEGSRLEQLFEEHLTTDRAQAFKSSPRAYQNRC